MATRLIRRVLAVFGILLLAITLIGPGTDFLWSLQFPIRNHSDGCLSKIYAKPWYSLFFSERPSEVRYVVSITTTSRQSDFKGFELCGEPTEFSNDRYSINCVTNVKVASETAYCFGSEVSEAIGTVPTVAIASWFDLFFSILGLITSAFLVGMAFRSRRVK